MTAYYNEIDPFAAEWLRNLIASGRIPAGDVDERSIAEVSPDDLRGYKQCHFFAGIGGWAYAARLAGISDDYPLWTGSCPCQPFSVAGRQRGTDDERHLWPVFRDLIAQCLPAVVAGEQVASKAGRAWLSGVLADVEGLGYAGAGADLCAAGVGAPHIRQRLYWVADTERGAVRERRSNAGQAREVSEEVREQRVRADAESDRGDRRRAAHWAGAEWVQCADGKARLIEPGLEPLAHGVPGRVGRVRAYGNAIVPQLAAEFLMASLDGSGVSA